MRHFHGTSYGIIIPIITTIAPHICTAHASNFLRVMQRELASDTSQKCERRQLYSIFSKNRLKERGISYIHIEQREGLEQQAPPPIPISPNSSTFAQLIVERRFIQKRRRFTNYSFPRRSAASRDKPVDFSPPDNYLPPCRPKKTRPAAVAAIVAPLLLLQTTRLSILKICTETL
jgi:hypothetical protein